MIDHRGPVDHAHREAGATFIKVSGRDIVADFGDPDGEIAITHRLGLADLSHLPRVGFRGPGTRQWLALQGIQVPHDPNRADLQPDGGLAISRSWTELLLLADLYGASKVCARLESMRDEAKDSGAFVLPRYDGMFWFALSGERAIACLAKLCGVDMRQVAFPPGSVAQTSVARMTAVVVRRNIGVTPMFHVLGDSASAEYLWGSLIDAMREFDGRPVGLGAMRALAGEFE